MPDFNPGVLGIILWGIISYLFRKKKIPNNVQAENILEDNSSSLDYSDEIFYDQNLLDDSMLSVNQALDYIEPNLEFEDSQTKTSIDKDKKIHEASDYNYNPKSHFSLSEMLRDSNNLKSAFIVKEILDKPLSLRRNN